MAPQPPSSRIALGFATAPLLVPLLHAALELARSAEGPPGYTRYVLRDGLLAAALWTAPLSYLFAVGLGVPIVLALRALGRLTLPWVVAIATLAGGAAAGILGAALVPAEGLRATVLRGGAVGVAGAVLAALVALAFCAVTRVGWRGLTSRASP